MAIDGIWSYNYDIVKRAIREINIGGATGVIGIDGDSSLVQQVGYHMTSNVEEEMARMASFSDIQEKERVSTCQTNGGLTWLGPQLSDFERHGQRLPWLGRGMLRCQNGVESLDQDY
ncbi:hypothetical protein ACLOJK_032825 [Asimina triloba]